MMVSLVSSARAVPGTPAAMAKIATIAVTAKRLVNMTSSSGKSLIDKTMLSGELKIRKGFLCVKEILSGDLSGISMPHFWYLTWTRSLCKLL